MLEVYFLEYSLKKELLKPFNGFVPDTLSKIIDQIDLIQYCCLLLSKLSNANGINRDYGDFVLKNNYLRRWKKNDPVIFYSGLQILNPIIVSNFNKIKFSMNEIWDNLIKKNQLKGMLMESNLLHIGDVKTYEKFYRY